MYVAELQLENIKSFKDSNSIGFSKNINVLIGPNNAGKTAILDALLMLQGIKIPNPRLNSLKGRISVTFRDLTVGSNVSIKRYYEGLSGVNYDQIMAYVSVMHDGRGYGNADSKRCEIKDSKGNQYNEGVFHLFPKTSKDYFIFPFLAKRKTVEFSEVVNHSNARNVQNDLKNLYAKVDNILANPSLPFYDEFRGLCKEIFGYDISSFASSGGKMSGYSVTVDSNIPVSQMGEGVVQILGLLVALCEAKDKLFIIEELENDLHPKALKQILDVILEKSEFNQFVISTHSNVVLRYLGANSTTNVLNITMKIDDENIPLSEVSYVGDDPDERIKVLADLGYELLDFELWEGWLLLEESSAEKIIRDYLIPWFTPTLQRRLRTIAAQGVNDLDKRFIDFERLFTFVHLSSMYKGKAWVVADGDEQGMIIIEALKSKFIKDNGKWTGDNFRNFSKSAFEKYYPEIFQGEVEKVFAIESKSDRKQGKKQLLDKVLKWIDEDQLRAKKDFGGSAAEIILLLKNIERNLISDALV